jgi:hypothetical protein
MAGTGGDHCAVSAEKPNVMGIGEEVAHNFSSFDMTLTFRISQLAAVPGMGSEKRLAQNARQLKLRATLTKSGLRRTAFGKTVPVVRRGTVETVGQRADLVSVARRCPLGAIRRALFGCRTVPRSLPRHARTMPAQWGILGEMEKSEKNVVLIEAGEEVSNTVLICLNKSDSSSSSAGYHAPNMPHAGVQLRVTRVRVVPAAMQG